MTQDQTRTAVAQYYDRNTAQFLLTGAGEDAAIHRAIWAPGVATRRQALETLNRMVAEAVLPAINHHHAHARLLDLGCGVGGTATWLAGCLKVPVTGVTISPVQVRLATERARRLDLQDHLTFLLADFLNLPPIGPFAAAYAIESFAHAAEPRRFFVETAGQLAPAGRLVLCDDFLDEATAALDPLSRAGKEAGRAICQFTRAWHVPNLQTGAEAIHLAAENGLRLVENTDLTAYVRGFHPLVLKLVYIITRLPLSAAYWRNLSGGSALQVCIRRGWTRYRVLVFEKEGICTPSPLNATSLPSIS